MLRNSQPLRSLRKNVTQYFLQRNNFQGELPAYSIEESMGKLRKNLEASMTVENIIKSVINKSEGGLSDHPSDKGGVTKYGISIKWYRMAIDSAASEDVIKRLSLNDAIFLYKKYFWDPLHINEIESPFVQEKYFDMAINMGMGQAARLLQRACNILSQKDVLKEDGILGPISLEKVNTFGERILPVLRALQYMFYKSLVDNDPSQNVFWKGWRLRAYV